MESSLLIFYVFLISTFTTCFGVCIRKILQYKCSVIRCCGLEIIRNVELESRNNSNGSDRPLGPNLI